MNVLFFFVLDFGLRVVDGFVLELLCDLGCENFDFEDEGLLSRV